MAKGPISSSPKLHEDGYLLLYQNNSGKTNGNVVTITAAEGYVIKSVTFTIYSGGLNGNNGTCLEVTGATLTVDGNGNLILTADSAATSISLTSTGTAKATDRVHIASVTVVYDVAA